MSTQQIFDYLEGRLTADERAAFEKRVASEPALQKDLEAAREMERGFGALRKVEPKVDLLAGTRRRINAGKALATESDETRSTRHFPQWAWPLSAAAIMLLGFGFIFLREEVARHRATVALSATRIGGDLAFKSEPDHARTETAAASPAAAIADAGSLRDPLAKAAERNLPAPMLASEQIALPSPANELDARADEVIRIVSAVGGTALRGDASAGEQHVLAYIPQDEIENFRKAIARVSDADASRDGILAMDKLTAAEKDSVRKALDTPALQTETSKVSADRKTSEKEKESVAPDSLATAVRTRSLGRSVYSLGDTPAPAATPAAPMPATAAPAKPEQQFGLASASSAKSSVSELQREAPANPEPNRKRQKEETAKQLADAEPAHPTPITPQEMPAGAAGKIETTRANVNKDTSGTLTFSNTNSYFAGGIVMNGGTLQLQQSTKTDESANRSGTMKNPAQLGAKIGLASEDASTKLSFQSATDAFETKKTEAKQNRQLIEIIIRSTPPSK